MESVQPVSAASVAAGVIIPLLLIAGVVLVAVGVMLVMKWRSKRGASYDPNIAKPNVSYTLKSKRKISGGVVYNDIAAVTISPSTENLCTFCSTCVCLCTRVMRCIWCLHTVHVTCVLVYLVCPCRVCPMHVGYVLCVSGVSCTCWVCPVHIGCVLYMSGVSWCIWYFLVGYVLVYWLSTCGCFLLYPYCVFLFHSVDPVPEEDEEEVEGINPFSPGDPGPAGV